MKIGDRVTVTLSDSGRVIESHVTHTTKDASCGYIVLSPVVKRAGHIIGFHDGWFNRYWVVGLDDGSVIRVDA